MNQYYYSEDETSRMLTYGNLRISDDKRNAETAVPEAANNSEDTCAESSVASSLTNPPFCHDSYHNTSFHQPRSYVPTSELNHVTMPRTGNPSTQPKPTNTVAFDSLDDVENKLSAKQVYVENDNSKQILLTMAYGPWFY